SAACIPTGPRSCPSGAARSRYGRAGRTASRRTASRARRRPRRSACCREPSRSTCRDRGRRAMTLIKDEATAKLDAVGRAGMEAIGLFEDLAERLEEPALRETVASHAAAQRYLLERTADVRRARGELPQ